MIEKRIVFIYIMLICKSIRGLDSKLTKLE